MIQAAGISRAAWLGRFGAGRFTLALLALVSNAVVLLGASPGPTALAAVGLVCLLPGFALAAVLFPRGELDGAEWLALAPGLGFACAVAGGLALHLVPGPLSVGLVLGGADVLLVALLAAPRRGAGAVPLVLDRATLAQVALILLVAAALRLPNLGYSEYQGDEAVVVLRATAAIQGRVDALLIHKKGPAEILVPALVGGLAGRLDEGGARLPFALAGLAGLLAVYALGRAAFGPAVGVVAALLLAVNGFYVGFARIVQYPMLDVLFESLALLCVLRYASGKPGARRFLGLGLAFATAGLLTHWQAALLALPLAYLVLRRWRAEPSRVRGDLAVLLAVGLPCLLLLGGYYNAHVQHPYFGAVTEDYLARRVGGGDGGLLVNSLPTSAALSVVYASAYYILALGLAVVAAVLGRLLAIPARRLGLPLAALFLVGLAVVLLRPQWWQVGSANLLILFLGGLLVLLLVAPRPTPAWGAAWLWAMAPFTFYACVVSDARTHFLVAFPGFCLLAGCALVGGWGRLAAGWPRRAAAGAFAAFILLCGAYAGQVFVRHAPEYAPESFAAGHPPGFWLPTDDLPGSGWFGFPHRAGWRAIGGLFARGVLRGDYESNQRPEITTWYTLGAPHCDTPPQYADPGPRYYFVEEGVDRRDVSSKRLASLYQEVGRVTQAGRTTIHIYERTPTERPLGVLRAEDLAATFDARPAPLALDPALPYQPPLARMQHPLGADFGGQMQLVGYSLDGTQARPGGMLVATLYWRMEQRVPRGASVRVALEGARTWAESEQPPRACSADPLPEAWEPGQIVQDRQYLRLDAATPEGDYPLTVGASAGPADAPLGVRGADAATPARLILQRVAVRRGA